MASETARRQNNRDRALALLQLRGRVSNVELVGVAGLRAGGRIFELRQMGYRIEGEDASGGLYYYRYVGPPLPPHQEGLPL